MNEVLIRKAKKGDKDAFCRLMDENVQSMYKIAAAYLKNDEDVADAIQDTILSCYENLKSLKQNRYFKTWMIRILINKCKDMIQKKKLVTYTDQMPETPFHEEEYAAMEWAPDGVPPSGRCAGVPRGGLPGAVGSHPQGVAVASVQTGRRKRVRLFRPRDRRSDRMRGRELFSGYDRAGLRLRVAVPARKGVTAEGGRMRCGLEHFMYGVIDQCRVKKFGRTGENSPVYRIFTELKSGWYGSNAERSCGELHPVR